MSVSPVWVAERYRLIAPLGAGGMGRVWLARDEMLRRDVAIKEVVPPHGLTDAESEELRLRTIREARAAARLSDPHVVRIYDVIYTEQRPWIVMEYVPSRSLHQVITEDGPLTPHRAAEIGLAVLWALKAAHEAGVLHRDVKPGNVLLADTGRVVLTDFGLAIFEGGDGTVTRPGLILGSPQYIAPERAREGISGPEADLWSLGATLYAAVEGHSPYARSTTYATLTALATEDPDPPRRAGPLKPVLNALLRKDPRTRANAVEAERLLRKVATGEGRTWPWSLPKQRRARDGGSGLGPPSASPVVVASAAQAPPTPARPAPAKPTPAKPAASAAAAPAQAQEAPPPAPTPQAPEVSVEPETLVEPVVEPPVEDAAPAEPETPVEPPAEPPTETAAPAEPEPAASDQPEPEAVEEAEPVDEVEEPKAALDATLIEAGLPPSEGPTVPDAVSEIGSVETTRVTFPGKARGSARVPARSRRPGAPPAGGPRWRWVAVAAAAVVVIVLAALIANAVGHDARTSGNNAAPAASGTASAPSATTPAASTSPNAGAGPASPSASTGPGHFALPSGFHWYTDEQYKWSIAVPDGWTASRDQSYPSMLYFDEPTTPKRRLGVDRSGTPQPDPVADWTNLERGRSKQLPRYQRIKIEAVPYFQAAADWIYTYDGTSGRLEVCNRGFVVNDHLAHAIFWLTPAAQWDENQSNWNVIVASFQPGI